MKKTLIFCMAMQVAISIIFDNQLFAQLPYNKSDIPLELLASNMLPEDITKSIAVYPKWIDAQEVVIPFAERFQNPVIRKYNIKTGEYSVYEPSGERAPAPFSDLKLKIAKSAEVAVAKIQNPEYSPDKSKAAFTMDGNLHVYNAETEKIVQLTHDGSDVILNGYASWVYYEEILGRPSNYKAFWWSPDSKRIAFYRFDDSEVPMFPIYDPSKVKNQILATHYPMAGEKNPEVRVGFVACEGGETVWGDFNQADDQYFGIPFWNPESTRFIVPWMPRVQQDLYFYSVNPEDGKKSYIYKEHQDTWIDWPDQMQFTADGFYMVRDFSMWDQIYFQSYDGKPLKQITTGCNWGIKLLARDDKRGEIFFTAKREISTRTDIYKVSVKNGKITRISEGEYNYMYCEVSPDFKNVIAVRSNVATPYTFVSMRADGKGGAVVIADSKGTEFEKYNLALPEMVYIKTPDGYTIPAKITLPIGFEPSKKYPVIVYMYGGPNAPQVADSWSTPSRANQWWANQGVIQFTMDHRGSGHFGKEGLNFMYRNFYDIELQDFAEWGKYLQSLPYVDADKVGINGFSYGGSMTTLCVTELCEYFKYGIAGGGVYDWMLYDSHYTERYMDTPERNPQGYERTIVSKRIAQSGYRGDSSNYLMLTHGAADDNVHVQNTMGLALDLQNAGYQFDMMIYPRQLHGYRGAQGTFSLLADYAFWYRHLLNKPVPQVLYDALAARK